MPGSGSHDVTLVVSDLRGGGAQRVLSTLARAWATRGLRLCVITFAEKDSDKFIVHPKITRVSLNLVGQSRSTMFALVANVRRIYLLRKALRRANAPVVVAFITTTNILTILASAGLHSRIVVSERNDPNRQPLDWPWSTLRRWSYRYADAVTANSHGALQSLGSFVPRPKLFFVPNPVSLPPFSIRKSPRKQTILNVGRLSYQKAQDVLLLAYAQVVAKEPDWSLTIIGEGPREQYLHDQASSLGLFDQIDWVDWTTAIDRYYENAQIFVLPSRYEGMPNVLLEAMSFGLPSIVTDASPGPLEHIVDEENGLVVPAGNVQRMANAILRLIESPELRQRLGSAARARISEMGRDVVEDAWASALGLPLSVSQPVPKVNIRVD